MHNGRNAKKRKKHVIALSLLFVGAAFLAAGPANAAINLGGSGAGQGSALWGMYSDVAGSGKGSESGEAEGQADGGMAGDASAAWEGAANVYANPPDPQPVVDGALQTVEQVKAQAEAQAEAALAQKDQLAGRGQLDWGLRGDGAGSYDVLLGGDYAGGLDGTLLASGDKQVGHKVDARGEQRAVGEATAQAEGALDEIFGTLNEVWGKLHASFDLGLDGAAQALGNVGMDIAGIFGFQKGAEVANVDQLGLQKRLDVSAPAMVFERPDLPEVELPALALDQSGSVGADAAATAAGVIKG